MKNNILTSNYFFVDESGDNTFYNKKGEFIVGNENGSSKILLMGFVRTSEAQFLRNKLTQLHNKLCQDKYLTSIPSFSKTTLAFHAKDDSPEVKYEVFKLLKQLPFSCNIIVARKTEKVYNQFKGDTQKFYDSLITKLFQNVLHLANNNYIYIATRGNKKRQKPLENAIQDAIKYFEIKFNIPLETNQIILPQTPSGEPCLQITDYCNWAIQRAFLKNDMRYYNYLKEKFGVIIDLYDFKPKWKNFYSKQNPFDIKKISPL